MLWEPQGRSQVNQRERTNQLKSDIAKHPRFRSRCYICHCKKSRSGFLFHHIWYESWEMTYSDFKTPLEYYTYLRPLIESNPKRFLFLCSDHHQALERMARWGKNLPRLIRAVRQTQKMRGIKSLPQIL